MKDVKLVAFYLPQYHEIPENNKWWGKGFTEWTNVKKAKSLFEGHRQPHTPAKTLGYYDLSKIDVIENQAELAKKYGIHGFCFYHYWFNGKKLLEAPLQNILESEKPDFPFCVCWANENWTRTWDGQQQKILISQKHSPQDDLAFINDLIEVFKDKRYIKIDGKPLLAIYRTSLFPNIKRSAAIWREAVQQAGFDDLYLVRVEGIEDELDPKKIGFDAGLEFAPDWRLKGSPINQQDGIYRSYIDRQIFENDQPTLYDYNLTMLNMITKTPPAYKYFRGAFPAWDNTPRRGEKGTVFWGSNPENFEYFLSKQIENTKNNELLSQNEKIVFINAWNEWGEGCYLEPDTKSGNSALKAVKNALTNTAKNDAVLATATRVVAKLHRMEEELDKLHKAYEVSERDNLYSKQRADSLSAEIIAIKMSRTWRLRNKLARFVGKPQV